MKCEVAALSPSGSECYLETHLPEPQTEGLEDGKEMPTHLEDENRMFKENAQADLSGDKSSLPGSDNCLVVKKDEQFLGSVSEYTVTQDDVDGVRSQEQKGKAEQDGARSRDQKGKALKEKGTSSILRFLQTQNHVSPNQETKEEISNAVLGKNHSLSGEASCNTMPPEGAGSKTIHNSIGQNRKKTDAYSYNIDEIDPNVVNELPLELQAEVRAWLRPQKRANNSVKRGFGIAHYFSADKNLKDD